ncbi:uncharacterized protein LOC128201988 [Galleria mellonella]|uniref:Uncharacterized protein LOC128201988 n=1 Tax=Galleria mellonella TaxID=7137 RepID=A0ABM3MZ90_GALME|nr:uncharacterized protein LOC128201988 [Galleria mellonella]
MGKKNKSGSKANVFKVAGAKSLKKTKAKAVNLGLKNIKQKILDIDKQFLEINKNPKSKEKAKPEVKPVQKKPEKNITKEEVANTAEQIVKMDL